MWLTSLLGSDHAETKYWSLFLSVTCQLLISQLFLGTFEELLVNWYWSQTAYGIEQWYHVYTGSHNTKLQKVFHKNRSHNLAQCEEGILPRQFSQSTEASVNTLKFEIMKFQFKYLLLEGSFIELFVYFISFMENGKTTLFVWYFGMSLVPAFLQVNDEVSFWS